MFAIRGSGFGLYGYLPALVEGCGQLVLLPDRYRTRLDDRSDLRRLAGAVRWRPDDASALDQAEGVVLALRPSAQSELLPQCLARHNLEYFLVEKPMAPSPEAAAFALDALIQSRRTFRVGYIFRNTFWGKQILRELGDIRDGGLLSIRWTFLADHFLNDLRNWKRFTEMGGGAIRFYGIHLVALLAEAGYSDVLSSRSFGASPEECEKWIAVLAGPGLPRCHVIVDTRSATRAFDVRLAGATDHDRGLSYVADLADPFDPEVGSTPFDRRIPALTELCRSLWEVGRNEYAWYHAVIGLWRNIEIATSHTVANCATDAGP